jgi:hypothetical protein
MDPLCRDDVPCGLTKPLDSEIILLAPRLLTRLHITADRPQSPAA